MNRSLLAVWTLLSCHSVAICGMVAVGAEEAVLRTPQFPLKDKRQLLTDDQIALARRNVAAYPSAKALADGIIEAANRWLECSRGSLARAWSDQDVRRLIPSAKVPRAFNEGTEGCPKCGKAIYEKAGTYPWIIDPRIPFKVKCPVDGSVYPGNDFEQYYLSGFQDKKYLEGEYSDDGWGWVSPEGHRYWFVACANHWTWMNHIVPGVLNLSRAYTLTGDARYAHKAVVMLDRIAEVYPAMDHASQSRYGQLQAQRGIHYGGKIVNAIWETGILRNLAESYDAVWETIDGDAALRDVTGRNGQQVRAHIEANLLEEGIDAYFKEEIRGNFGMHQCALVYAVAARQYGKVDEWLDGIFTYSGPSPLYTGLNYALYNLVYRDGLPYETSPGYNWSWVDNITTVAETLKLAKRDVYGIPKTKRLYDGVLDLVNVRAFTPALGDSGSVYGGMAGRDARTYQAAYRAYGDPRYLGHLAGFNGTGDAGFVAYESLFQPPVESAPGGLGPQQSRLLDGYGMAILNNEADTVSAALYYGYRGGHGHFDRLHFDVFANGQPMMPDLGYPDFMNEYVSGIFTWSKNTINHNTVSVDAGRQRGNQAGTVHLFVNGPFARALDIDAPETYPQCSMYRRCLIMVDRPDGGAYFVDIFSVAGGHQHDYSLHGPPGTFQAIGGTWDTQPAGTLAGENVRLGEIYDDPVLGAKDYSGGYGGYAGSGFQHLVNVRRHRAGAWIAEWAHEKDPDAKLRIRIPDQPDQEIILADAQVSPVKYPQLITYLIARRRSAENLHSRFISVIEPFKAAPFIKTAQCHAPTEGTGVVVEVAFENGDRDIILHSAATGEKTVEACAVRTDARLAVVQWREGAAQTDVFLADGSSLSVAGQQMDSPTTLRGEVVSVSPQQCQVRIRSENLPDGFDAQDLAGRVAHFSNAFRKTAHPVATARMENDELILRTRDDLLVGRARLTGVESGALATDTAFMFAPVYRGVFVSDDGFSTYRAVQEVKGGKIQLAEPLPEGHPFQPGKDVWLVNIGPGDRLEIPAVASSSK